MGCSNICEPGDLRQTDVPNKHHIIPAFRGDNCKDYRDFYEALGVDPENWRTVVTREQHFQGIHYASGEGRIYNELWAAWIAEHCDEVDADDVYEFAAQMMEDFDIPIRMPS